MTRPFEPRTYTLADREAFDRSYSWPPAQPLAQAMPKWLVHLYRAAFGLAGLALIALALS